MTESAHRLPPIIAPTVGRFLANAALIEEVVARFGSPVNVVFPQVFSDNVAALQDVLGRHKGLSHRICYAHKANQAAAFVAEAYRCGLGIDVASIGELDSALSAGFAPDRIEATGPKGERFLRVLLDAGILVNVDNLWELRRIRDLMRQRDDDTPAAILLRLSGFGTGDTARVSRFGIDVADAMEALGVAAAPDSRLDLRGIAFHLDSGDVGERTRALAGCLDVLEKAYALGLHPEIIDIGGGFRQAFSADPEAFAAYLREHGYPSVPSFHKYGNDIGGAAFLATLLAADLHETTAAGLLRDAMVELWLEPGKALLDNAGITIATVEFTKQLADGTTVVNLDIGRDTVTPADQEVMLDPVIVYRRPPEEYTTCPDGLLFGGRLCLERDLVSRHLIYPERLPLPGDRVVFVNTAAYHMDLSATTALMHPLPPKIVATETTLGFSLEPDDRGEDAMPCCTGTSPN